jgi:hypothetical protein
VIPLINYFNLKLKCIECDKIKYKNSVDKVCIINDNQSDTFCIKYDMCNHSLCENCIINLIKLNNYNDEDEDIYCKKCKKNMFCIFQKYYDEINYQEYVNDLWSNEPKYY